MTTLADRIAANTCRTEGCSDPRLPDSSWCRVHLRDYWRETRHVSPWVQLAAERRLTPKALS